MSAQSTVGDGTTNVAADGYVDVVDQAVRRELNEQTRSANQRVRADSNRLWVRPLGLHRDDRARHRRLRRCPALPARFFVKEGHEVTEKARIVVEAANYVVEASGRGGVYAVSGDPRGHHRRIQEGGGTGP